MIREALDEHARRVAKDMGDRSQTVGASEVGLCIRRVWMAKKGKVPVEGSWGASMRGTTMEEQFWVPAMRAKFGAKLLFVGPGQVNIRRGQLSATPDGLLTDQPKDLLRDHKVPNIGPSRSILVECKTIDPRIDLKAAKDENVLQVQAQLGLMRDPKARWYVKGREIDRPKFKSPDWALISYTDASFWDDVEEFAIKFDQEVYDALVRRAGTIFGATSMDEVKPEGWITGGKECEYCPFATECGIDRRRVPTGERPVDAQFIAEIEDLCIEHNKHRRIADAEEAKRKEIQVELKNRLRAKGIRKIPGLVSWWPVAGRTGIDKQKLAADLAEVGLDITDYETTGEESDSMRVS